jgi:hypothetical protein
MTFDQLTNLVLENTNIIPDMEVYVLSKKFNLRDVKGGKLYHGSKTDILVGEYLIPYHVKNFKESQEYVSVTSSFTLAKYWASQIKRDGPIFIYEIAIPDTDLEIWRVSLENQGESFTLQEGRTKRALIIDKTII